MDHTVATSFFRQTVGQGTGPEHLTRGLGMDGDGVIGEESDVLLIMLTGFVIFSAAFSIKYGINPWIRLSPANVSDASSEATKV